MAHLRLLLPLLPLCITAMTGNAATEFHVAPDGDDSNIGSPKAPFANMERARGAIRTLKSSSGLPPGGVTVWVHGGTYERTAPFELTAEDSGSAESPVTYRAYPGETVRLHGARFLAPSRFSIVSTSSPVWSRLAPETRGHLRQADLHSLGITNFGTLLPRGFFSSSTPAAMELFFSSTPMPLARWPDPAENSADRQTPTSAVLRLFGTPSPDVSGVYETSGSRDGVHTYMRKGLLDGKQYHLYRQTWPVADGRILTAWFLTTQPSGYPAATSGPFWHSYSRDLVHLEPAQGGSGSVSLTTPETIRNGFALVAGVSSSNAFHFARPRPERWTQAGDPWFHGYWKYPWADFHLKASSIDTRHKLISLDRAPEFGIEAGTPYYAENLLEEITTPGEWYLDRTSGILYFWPPTRLRGREIAVSMLETPLLILTGACHVIIADITFEMTRGDLVSIRGGHHNVLQRCTLRNAGNYAAKISGTRNGLSRCAISDTGDGGVLLSGGDRASLTPAGNYVTDCTLTRFGRWCRTYTPGVRTDDNSVGLVISHNRFHHAPHSAILLSGSGNNHVVEYNIIHDVCQWASDAGAIYLGRDLGARGTVIRFNFIRDIASPFTGCGTQGIYLDDCISGIHVYGNVLYRIAHFGIQNGGGRDNIIENNIIARCGGALVADARGLGWMMKGGGSLKVWQDLQKLPYRERLWSNAFPDCAAIPANWETITNGQWMAPASNVFSRNVAFSNGVFVSENDQCFQFYREITNNLADTHPLFADEAGLDLTLATNSPAFAIPGFKPIPFRAFGPRP